MSTAGVASTEVVAAADGVAAEEAVAWDEATGAGPSFGIGPAQLDAAIASVSRSTAANAARLTDSTGGHTASPIGASGGHASAYLRERQRARLLVSSCACRHDAGERFHARDPLARTRRAGRRHEREDPRGRGVPLGVRRRDLSA